MEGLVRSGGASSLLRVVSPASGRAVAAGSGVKKSTLTFGGGGWVSIEDLQ